MRQALKRVSAFSKKAIVSFVGISTVLSLTCAPFMVGVPTARAGNSFFVTAGTPAPNDTGVAVAFTGDMIFNTAVNSSTVVYDSSIGGQVFLLNGAHNYQPDNLLDIDIETFQVAVDSTDNKKINFSLSSGALGSGAWYTIMVQDVCAAGYTSSTPDYCVKDFFLPFQTTGTSSVTSSAIVSALGTQSLGASSSAVAVLGLEIADTESATLNSISIGVGAEAGAQFDPTADLAALAADNSSGAALYADDGDNVFDAGDTAVTLAAPPSWVAAPGGDFWQATLTPDSPPTLPASLGASAYNYFLVVRTASGAANGHIGRIGIPFGGIVTSETAEGNVPYQDIPSDPITIDIVGPFIEDVALIDAHTIDVMFNEELESSSIAGAAYTLDTSAGGDTETVTSKTLQPDNRTIRIYAAGATIVNTGDDTIAINNAVTDLAGNVNTSTSAMDIYGGGGAFPVVISQVVIGQASGDNVNEFIELYNTSNSRQDLTNIHLFNVSDAGAHAELALTLDDDCDGNGINNGAGSSTCDHIPGNGYYLITNSNSDFGSATGNDFADAVYSAEQLAINEAVYISFSNTSSVQVIDLVGWGSAVFYENIAASSITENGNSLERKANSAATIATMAAGDADNGNGFDSQDNSFDFLLMSSYSAQNTSITETPGGAGIGAENSYPFIDHTPINMAYAGEDLEVIARMGDDSGSLASADTSLVYQDHAEDWGAATTIHGIGIGAGMFKFIIPSSDLDAGTDLDYYLSASDGSLTSYGYEGPMTNVIATDAQANPFYIDLQTAGTRSISGKVQDSFANNLSGVTVAVMGTAKSVTTAANGTYTLSGLYDGTYSVVAAKEGYLDWWFDNISVNASSASVTGLNFVLSVGTMGSSGDMEKPWVEWNVPNDGMMGAPVALATAPLIVRFSETLDSNTVNSTNVYLTTNGADRVAGTLTYSNQEVQFISSADLEMGTTYAWVFTPGVRDVAGNPIEGNQPDNTYIVMFTTFSDASTATYGQGMAYPPFVSGSTPVPGTPDAPINTKLIVTFSEAIDSSTVTVGNSGFIKLFNITTGAAVIAPISASLDTATKTKVTVIPLDAWGGSAQNLTASNQYRLAVYGGIKSINGIQMSCPQSDPNGSEEFFRAEFSTSASADTGAPVVSGTSLEAYRASFNCDMTAGFDCLVSVPVNEGIIGVSFSKNMDSSTLTAANVTLKTGTSSVKGVVDYDATKQTLRFVPNMALNVNTKYTLTLTGGAGHIADLMGNTLTTTTIKFTTGASTDTTRPFLDFARATEYKLAVSYSEAMNAAKITDTSRWSSSVLNPANYILRDRSSGPGDIGQLYTTTNLADSTNHLGNPNSPLLKYDSQTFTLTIEGLEISGNGFSIVVNNVTDLSGNIIQNSGAVQPSFGQNLGGGPIEYSSQVGGMLGMEGGGMMGSGGGGMDMGMMAMMPTGVMPMNMLAGIETSYEVNIALERAIPANGQIILSFPRDAGFNISGAKNADLDRQFVHQDINGPGPGTVILGTAAETSGGLNNDGVTVDSVARTITITLGAVGTAGNATADTADDHDFLHIELDGIKNATKPAEGYQITIKTKNSAGNLIKAYNDVMSFYLQPAGKYVISGTVSFPGNITTAPTDDVFVIVGSPMTGPMEKQLTFTNASTANYEFTGLPSGDYMVFTQPMVTISGGIGNGDYFGSGMPLPIRVDDSATYTALNEVGTNPCNSDTACYYDKDLSFTSTGGSASVTVNIVGDFSGANACDIDIFAGAPGNFSVKTVALNADYTAGAPYTTTLPFPADDDYMVGIGPAMEMGMFTKGPMMMPNWMPPPPQQVVVSGTASPGTVTFTVGATSAQPIVGNVYNQNNEPIGNVDVFAHSPMGGNKTTTDKNDGSFTLNVPEGSYRVGVFIPGLPPVGEVSVDVFNGQMYVNGAPAATVTLYASVPDQTIIGTVTDGTNPVASASVYAYCDGNIVNNACFMGPGHAGTMTGSAGDFTLFVTPGTWKVGAYLPGYGDLPEKTAIVLATDTSVTLEDFAPITGVTYVNISGSVSIGGVTQTGMPIRAMEINDQGNFTGYGNDDITDDIGAYQIRVKANKDYRVDIWTPEYGEVAVNDSGAMAGGTYHTPTAADPHNIEVAGTNVTGFDLAIGAGAAGLSTLDIIFTNGGPGMMAYVDIDKIDGSGAPLGMGRHFDIIDLSGTTSITLPPGDYVAFAQVPGFGGMIPEEGKTAPFHLVLVANATDVATFVVPANSGTITGTVCTNANDCAGTAIPNAFVHIDDFVNHLHFDAQANSSGVYTLLAGLPVGDTANFMIGAEKKGYVGMPEEVTLTGAGLTKNIILTKSNLNISGQVLIGSVPATQGFIRAERMGGGFSGAPIETDGSFTVTVTAGEWRIFAMAEGYQETAYSGNPVNTNNIPASVNFVLTQRFTGTLAGPKAKPMIPNSGGVFEDPNAGLKITAEPNALVKLGSSAAKEGSTTYQIQGKETSNVYSTPTKKPLGNKGKDITVLDGDKNGVKQINKAVAIEMEFTVEELEADGIDSFAKAEAIVIGRWNDNAQTYELLPTTISFSPSKEELDRADGLGWDGVEKATFTFESAHFTVFTPLIAKDGLAPSAPTALTGTPGNGQAILTWTPPTTNADSSALDDLLGYELYRSETSTGTYAQVNTADIATAAYTDTAANWTTYYYKVTTADTGGNESAMSSLFQICVNPGVSNGTVSATNCAITCDSGYHQIGNSCVSTGGTVFIPSGSSSDTTTAVEMPTTSTGDVSATRVSGGKTSITTSADTEVSVELPAYAISADTDISIASVETTNSAVASVVSGAPAGKSIVGGYVYNMTASSAGVSVSSFSRKLTITLTYTDTQIAGMNESHLEINYWDTGEEQWFALPTTVDKAANTLTAKTDHFTYFAILAGEYEDTGEDTGDDESADLGSLEVPTTGKMTQAELRAKIANILSQIKELQAILYEMRGETGRVRGCVISAFNRTLKAGMAGNDVKCLQIILNSSPDTQVASSGVGSPGNETNYFGKLTKAAAIKFQQKYAKDVLKPHGLTKGTGFVGRTTRAKLNNLLK